MDLIPLERTTRSLVPYQLNQAFDFVESDSYIIQLASPSQKLICRVERIRDTRTFW